MAQTEQPKSRYRSARERAESHTGGRTSSSVQIPEGAKLFKLKAAGSKVIEILPYRVGKGNPFAAEGELHYERTYHAHKSVGVNEDMVICLAETAGKPCPVCEYRKKLARDPDADEKLIKSLAPKERQLFNVFDPAEPDRGVQIWDVSYHLFGRTLDDILKNADEEDGLDFFYHPKRGKTLKLGVVEETFQGRAFFKVTSILFRDRKEPIDAELLTATHCLDDLLIIMPYEKLKAMFLQTSDDAAAGGDEAPPAKKKAAAADDDDLPPPKKKAPVDDDDPPPAKKQAPADDDDPPPAKKKAPVDDDDDPPPMKKKAAPADDDDPPPAKKKSAPADDDDPPPAKKAAAKNADDDEW